MRLEQVAVAWLKELFGLPAAWSGVLHERRDDPRTSPGSRPRAAGGGCSTASTSRRRGSRACRRCPCSASGFVHASALKALAMLGIGRRQVRTFADDESGRLDLDALEAALRDLEGAPAILVATAGDVNTGAVRPDRRHGGPRRRARRVAPRRRRLRPVRGGLALDAGARPRRRARALGRRRRPQVAERPVRLRAPSSSTTAALHEGAFAAAAAYLGSESADRPVFSSLAPEMSRRARALTVWATLRAYGRDGYRAMVERHLELARRLAAQVDADPELERLADVAAQRRLLPLPPGRRGRGASSTS